MLYRHNPNCNDIHLYKQIFNTVSVRNRLKSTSSLDTFRINLIKFSSELPNVAIFIKTQSSPFNELGSQNVISSFWFFNEFTNTMEL